jgi:hypothetical protein
MRAGERVYFHGFEHISTRLTRHRRRGLAEQAMRTGRCFPHNSGPTPVWHRRRTDGRRDGGCAAPQRMSAAMLRRLAP